jgi:hypothetical protein
MVGRSLGVSAAKSAAYCLEAAQRLLPRNIGSYLGGALAHANEAEVVGSAGFHKGALLYSDAIVAN